VNTAMTDELNTHTSRHWTNWTTLLAN